MDDGKMNMNKMSGQVSFYLKLKQGLEVIETNYEALGILYKKRDKYYLFFDETNFDNDSITKCRLEFNQNEIRIRRDGEVIVDQICTTSERTQGYIKTIYGRLESEVKTHRYTVEEQEIFMRIIVDYDLFVAGERLGNYQLIIQFNKEAI